MEPQEFEQAPPTIEVLGPDGYERRPVTYYDTELDGPFRGVPMTNVGGESGTHAYRLGHSGGAAMRNLLHGQSPELLAYVKSLNLEPIRAFGFDISGTTCELWVVNPPGASTA